jgi:hypothetical protein
MRIDSAANTVRKDLINQIAILGFNRDVAEFGAGKVNYRSAEEAIGYLTDKDDISDKYVHEYVPFKNDLCFICEAPPSQHLAHIEEELK